MHQLIMLMVLEYVFNTNIYLIQQLEKINFCLSKSTPSTVVNHNDETLCVLETVASFQSGLHI